MKTKIYKLGKRKVKVTSQDHIIGEVISTVKDITKGIGNQITTDNVLVRTRDKIISYFVNAKPRVPQSVMDAALIKNQMRHADIPNRKVGGNYNQEFKRLYQYVIDVFNGNGRGDLAEIFERTVPVFTPENHDVSYIPELLAGKIRAIPQPAQPQDVAAEIANDAIKTREIAVGEFNPAMPVSQSSKILAPFKPIMTGAVERAGYVAPKEIDPLAIVFYEKIVKPATQSTYDADNLDDAIVDSILYFIATLQQKKESGEQMNKVYTFIADKATQLQEKGGDVAKDAAGQKVGSFVLDNALLLGIAAVVVIIAVSRK